MQVPFSIDQFFEVFKNYNLSVWPAQLLLYLLALTSMIAGISGSRGAGKTVSLILSVLWIWMGAVYHLIYFTSINNAAYGFGIAFILQGVLFFYFGIIRNHLSFRFHADIYGISGSFLILFALLIYPVIGYYKGHVYPTSPTFGLPCPTTIFTFGLLLWTDKKIPSLLLIIPFAWSLLGLSAALSLGVMEDLGLLVSAIVFAFLQARKNRKRNFINTVNANA